MSLDRRALRRDGALRSIAILRILTVVLIAVTVETVPLPFKAHLDHPLLEITLAVAVAYAVLIAWWVYQHPDSVPSRIVRAVIDVGVLCALTYESGGPVSQAKKAFFVLPVAAAMVRNPRVAAAWTIATMTASIVITLGHPAAEGPAGAAGVYAYAGYVGLVGAAATMLSAILARERNHILTLAGTRRQLLAWSLSAEDRAREELSYQLHDGPVQNLLAAARLHARARRGDISSLDQSEELLRTTIAELRHAIFELSPHTLSQAGLIGAIRAVAADAFRQAGLYIDVDLDENAAGAHDDLLFACARELVNNVVKHAQATRLEISLRRVRNEVVLTVADDGIGLDVLPPSRPGHLGLSAMHERISVVNGQLSLIPTSQAGARIKLQLPILADVSSERSESSPTAALI